MIKKAGPNLWHIKLSVRVPGRIEPVKRQEKFTGTKTEADARAGEIIKNLRVAASAGRSLNIQEHIIRTFSDAVEMYKENRRLEGRLSEPHERKIDFLDTELGHIELSAFADRFEAYIKLLMKSKSKHGRTRSSASVNRYVEIVRAVFNFLIKSDLIEKNPISKVRFPKLEEKARDRYLNEDERLRLLNAIREHRPYILPIVQYMLLVPCRLSELTSAKREQYNQFNGTIFIPDSKADIPIYKPVPVEMKSYFDSIPVDCPFLFYREDENGYHQLGTLQKPWAFCLKKANISNARKHDLRHVAASDLYEAGNPERMIMDIAGWKTPMLSTYRHKNSLRSAKAIQFRATTESPQSHHKTEKTTTELPQLRRVSE